MRESGFKRLFRSILLTLNDNGMITYDDLKFIESKIPNRDDLELILFFLEEAGIIKLNSELNAYILVNRRIVRKVVERMRKN